MVAVLCVALTMILIVSVRHLFVVVTVAGASMEPTFHTGDRLLSRRWGLAKVHPGDVVVLQGVIAGYDAEAHPVSRGAAQRSSAMTRRSIKRVAAVPGDHVPHIMADAVGTDTIVPPGKFLVLGDNVRASADSRVYGYVHAENITAVIVRPVGS